MEKLLFPDFLQDPKQYAEAEAFWQTLWSKIVATSSQAAEWRFPWLNTHFQNGSPCRDGNPIFSAVNEKRQRGIRVIQTEADSQESNLHSWGDYFGAKDDPESLRELVISCVLSERTACQASELLGKWIEAP